MKILAAVAFSALALFLAGCVDLDEEVTLNPDGSGKVVIHSVFPPDLDLTGKSSTPEKQMQKAVREELEKSEGVDAWKDVSATLRDDGKIDFKATAYFKDFSKLKLKNRGQSGPVGLSLTREPSGAWVILGLAEKGPGPKREPPAEKPGEDEVKAKMKEQRAQYQQMKPLMEGFLKESRLRVKLNLPGAVAETNNFKKVSASAIEIGLEGKTMLKVLDDLMMDDAFLRKQVEAGKGLNDPPDEEVMIEKLFGQKGPLRAVVKGPLKAAFDYEAEAGPARKDLPEILQRFGAATPAAPIESAKGGGFKSVRVAGVQYVHFRDDEREIHPLNGAEGLTLSVVAEFPGSVLAVKDGKVSRAAADSGTDLLPEGDFNREIHWPRLSKDRAAVTFDVKLNLPPAEAKGVREISGVLTYVVGAKTKDVDLGIAEFKSGARGKAMGAEIESIEDHPFEKGAKSVSLKLAAAQETIKSVTFYDDAGKPIESESSGWSGFNDTSTFSYTLKKAPPAKGKVVAAVYDDLKSYQAPFSLRNLDLLGRQLK